MNTPRIRLFRAAAALAVVGLALAACGSDSDESSGDGPEAASGAAAIGIDNAWARTSPANVENGAAYMTITSPDGDTLLAAEADATIAGMVQIHETVMAEESTDETMSMDSMADSMAEDAPMEMTMREVESIELPAGESVALEPGGYHIMLMELAAPLELGQTFSLELIFEKAGTKTVEVTVADEAP